MPEYDKKTLKKMIDGELPWNQLEEIISGEKDSDRFEKMMEILEERTDWDEEIILPLQEHLYIVAKDGERIVKCDCGYEFGNYKENWKKSSQVRVRDSKEQLEELYPEYMTSDPDWMEIREYYCPGCYTLLDTEAVPPGYPSIFNFRPDIDTFYEEWLGKPTPDKEV